MEQCKNHVDEKAHLSPGGWAISCSQPAAVATAQRSALTTAESNARREPKQMEASSSLPLPLLAASNFLHPPHLLAPTCPRRVVPFVRATAQTLEAPETPKAPRPSPRRSAVAEVKASPDPVAALNRYSWAPLVAVNFRFPEIVRTSCGLRD